MEAKDVLEKLFDQNKLLILKFFLDNPEQEFYLRELSKRIKIPVTTTFRLIKKLKELEIIIEHKIKKFKLYSLNSTKSTAFLQELFAFKKSALNEFIEQTSRIEGVEKIILHGKEEKDKANILLIGTNIPVEQVKKIVFEIKEMFNFSVIDLTLDPEQFSKMSNMGLFPGRRTTLFQK
ncbi:MAG: winged helix-turn-helix domain-containing protein [Nanoarchaeota archaeon]|nr:winged helix-turn-helix domain-containing protein [Nanoarchaeota archaeon]MBU1031119.1 winged helix-turn-helix domain-containing protein [Nanoarchaeota archaeon]MBU1850707.1 winged helix-turn-helix domain-containing protein [Nanoarchaeota archaeon]